MKKKGAALRPVLHRARVELAVLSQAYWGNIFMAYILMAYIVMACIVMACIAMACIVMAYTVWAYLVVAHIAMAYTVTHIYKTYGTPMMPSCSRTAHRWKAFG